MKLEVLEIKKETPTIISLSFKPEKPVNFKPGQYFVYKLDVSDPKGKTRDFSIARSPTEKDVAAAFRQTGSIFKQKLASLKPGDTIDVIGPLGHFVLKEDKPAVMIAGGIGITPFRSMIRYAADKKLNLPMTLFYANRQPDEIAFKKDFDELQKKNKHLKIVYTVDKPDANWKGLTGYINDKMILDNIGSYKDKFFYVCGPPGLVDVMVSMLEKMGVDSGSINIEHFTGY